MVNQMIAVQENIIVQVVTCSEDNLSFSRMISSCTIKVCCEFLLNTKSPKIALGRL